MARRGIARRIIIDLCVVQRRPWLMLTILALSGAGFILQSFWPPAIDILQWNAGLVQKGEVWRLITGLFVHTNGVPQITLNLSVLIVLGNYVELRWSRWAWVGAFLAGTFAAEAVGVFWYPVGGGNSVGLGGLFGLALVGAMTRHRAPWLLRSALPVAGLSVASILSILADIHGPPIVAGALAGLVALNAGGLLARRSRQVASA